HNNSNLADAGQRGKLGKPIPRAFSTPQIQEWGFHHIRRFCHSCQDELTVVRARTGAVESAKTLHTAKSPTTGRGQHASSPFFREPYQSPKPKSMEGSTFGAVRNEGFMKKQSWLTAGLFGVGAALLLASAWCGNRFAWHKPFLRYGRPLVH